MKKFNPAEFVKDMIGMMNQFKAENRKERELFRKEIRTALEEIAKKRPKQKATLNDIKKVASKSKRLRGWNYYSKFEHVGIKKKDLDEFSVLIKEMMEVYGVTVIDAQLTQPNQVSKRKGYPW